MKRSRQLLIALVLLVLGLLIGIAVQQPQPVELSPVEEAAPSMPPPKRYPVAGAAGLRVEVSLDGQAKLLLPNGQTETFDKAKELGILVLRYGFVAMPEDAVITHLGEQKATFLLPDGSIITYYVDGQTAVVRPARLPEAQDDGARDRTAVE